MRLFAGISQEKDFNGQQMNYIIELQCKNKRQKAANQTISVKKLLRSGFCYM
jgi:hypothetical protein